MSAHVIHQEKIGSRSTKYKEFYYQIMHVSAQKEF